MKRIAMILSGCGVFDGAEIHEAVLTMLAIKKHGAEYTVFAPDILQHHVVNHITGEEMEQQRNVMIESARIARGKILSLAQFDANSFDAIVFPGGFGVAKNLSSFAFKGSECTINTHVEHAVLAMHKLNKPIGALCIAPAIIAKILGNVEVTIGSDKSTAQNIEQMGAKHFNTTHSQVLVDKKNKVCTTPCYMLDSNILQIAEGADNLVKELLLLCK